VKKIIQVNYRINIYQEEKTLTRAFSAKSAKRLYYDPVEKMKDKNQEEKDVGLIPEASNNSKQIILNKFTEQFEFEVSQLNGLESKGILKNEEVFLEKADFSNIIQ